MAPEPRQAIRTRIAQMRTRGEAFACAKEVEGLVRAKRLAHRDMLVVPAPRKRPDVPTHVS